MRAIYRLRDGGLLQLLLEADTLQDMVYRYRYLSLILKRDEDVLREFGQKKEEMAATQKRLKDDRNRLYQLRLEVSRQKDAPVEDPPRKHGLVDEGPTSARNYTWPCSSAGKIPGNA